MIVYISIGNSDDKLSQYDWSRFVGQVRNCLDGLPKHGEWFSLPDSGYQNGCFCVDVPDEEKSDIQGMLRRLAGTFRQDSIAWAEVPHTEFLGDL